MAGVEASERESFYLFQYRVLVFLLFRSYPFIKFDVKTSHVQINKMSQLALSVGYRSYKVRKALRELERLHLIHDLKFAYNKASFYLSRIELDSYAGRRAAAKENP